MPRRENGQNSQTMRVTLFVRESFRIKTVDVVGVEGYLLVYNSINRYGQSLLCPVFHSYRYTCLTNPILSTKRNTNRKYVHIYTAHQGSYLKLGFRRNFHLPASTE